MPGLRGLDGVPGPRGFPGLEGSKGEKGIKKNHTVWNSIDWEAHAFFRYSVEEEERERSVLYNENS